MRRSSRPQAPRIWIDIERPFEESPGPIKAQKENAPKPQTRPATKAAELVINNTHAYQQRDFSPSFSVPFESMRVLYIERDPFSLFLRLLGESSLLAIVEAANAKAQASMHPHQEFARPWVPLTRGELLCWLGLLFYIANHIEIRRHEYWRASECLLTRWMGRNRWKQIRRFLTFNTHSGIEPQWLDAP